MPLAISIASVSPDTRTGRERLAGADAHSFVPSCTGSGTNIEARCTMVETDAVGTPIGTRVHRPEDLWRERHGIPPDLVVYFGDLAWRSNGTLGHDHLMKAIERTTEEQVFTPDLGGAHDTRAVTNAVKRAL